MDERRTRLLVLALLRAQQTSRAQKASGHHLLARSSSCSGDMGKGGHKPKPKQAAKAGLVEKNGALSPRFRAVLAEIFKRFDADGDGALGMPELEAFAKASGTGTVTAEDQRQLGKLFDADANGNLTLKGFCDMYLMQTNHNAEDTWRDLVRLGYSKELEVLNASETSTEDLTKIRMDEMRAALAELKDAPDSASAHRRVGGALEALGRADAAQKEYRQADELEAKANSTVEEQD